MRGYQFIWVLHRWVGIAVGVVLLLSATTGFLLLVKKHYGWLQPPAMSGTEAPAAQLQPLASVYDAVFALGLPQFRSQRDIARIDFRPDQRLHKVISRHDWLEVQVDAVTLATRGPAERRSDWIEQLHDGSFFGAPMHDFVMPAVAVAVCLLSSTGYVLWLWPKWQRRRRARRSASGQPSVAK